MEMEIPTIPKVALDNLLASMGGHEPVPLAKHNGFRQLPVPLFHGVSLQPPSSAIPSKPSSSSLFPMQGVCHMKDLDTHYANLFKDNGNLFAKEGNASLPPVKEKPKRVRKSRAAVLLDKGGALDLDANLDGFQQPELHSTKRRRSSAKLLGDQETAHRAPPRKQNRNKKKGKEEQLLSFSTNESSFQFSDSTSYHGNLGIYGLDSQALDLACHMEDISVDRKLSSDARLPIIHGNQGPQSNSAIDNSFGTNVSSIMQNFTRTASMDQVQRRPHDDGLSLGLFDPTFKGLLKESPASFSQSTKAHEEFPMCSYLESGQAPSANFWNTFQIHPTVSLDSLKAQKSTAIDIRNPLLDVASNGGKVNALPPSIFSLGSLHITQHSSGDRANSKMNQWFQAEPPKRESGETQSYNFNAFSQGNMLSLKLDSESDSATRPVKSYMTKECLFDIDLNKQSPEAEAAESIGGSVGAGISNPEVCNKAPAVTQTEVGTSGVGSCEAPDNLVMAATVCEPGGVSGSLQINACMTAPLPMSKREYEYNVRCLPDDQESDHPLDVSVTQFQKNEALLEESLAATVKSQPGTEQEKDATENAPSTLPGLVMPEVLDTAEPCITEMPYSPRMCATAHLLCEMANSASSFYVERGKNYPCATACGNDAYIQHPAKVARLSVLAAEAPFGTYKHMTFQKSSNEECTTRAQSRDRKDKVVPCHLDNIKGPTTEPWSLTPPRHASKNVCSRMSGSQSSESDRSACRGQKLYGVQKDLVSNIRQKKEQQVGLKASMKASSLFNTKDSKVNCKPPPKVSFLHTLPAKGLSTLSPKRRAQAETREALTAYGDGFAKASRPRSNTGKNCPQSSERTSNTYPAENGCCFKLPKPQQVPTYVEEIRHGPK